MRVSVPEYPVALEPVAIVIAPPVLLAPVVMPELMDTDPPAPDALLPTLRLMLPAVYVVAAPVEISTLPVV